MGMENDWRTRLIEMIDADGRSKRALSQATGFGENYVQQLLKDNKEPSFTKLAKLLSELGPRATNYVISGVMNDPTAQLRAAMVSYGVDRSQLDRAMAIIGTFKVGQAPEAQSVQSQPDDQSQPANPRRVPTP
jgi:transcriptional regulator with XRE-family HTH domain